MRKKRRWLARRSRGAPRSRSLTKSWERTTTRKSLIQTQINRSWTHTMTATKKKNKNRLTKMTTHQVTTGTTLSSLCKSQSWWANTPRRPHKLRLGSVPRNVRIRTRTCLVLLKVRFSSMFKTTACTWQTCRSQPFNKTRITRTVSGIPQAWAWLTEIQVLRSLCTRRMMVRRNLSRSPLKEVRQTVLV